MRESHRLWMRVCDLTEQADAEIDPLAEAWLRREAESVRTKWLNTIEQEKQDLPLRIAHGVLVALFGVIIVLGFAAMCADVIAGLL